MTDRHKPADATTNPTVPAWAELWHLTFVLIPRAIEHDRVLAELEALEDGSFGEAL